MQLRVQIQNDPDISINGIRFDTEMSDREFGNDMSGEDSRRAPVRFGNRER